jgi:hypothetical protein
MQLGDIAYARRQCMRMQAARASLAMREKGESGAACYGIEEDVVAGTGIDSCNRLPFRTMLK